MTPAVRTLQAEYLKEVESRAKQVFAEVAA